MKRNYVVAITGASGVAYAVRLLEALTATGCDVQLVISKAAVAVINQELDRKVNLDKFSLSMLGLGTSDKSSQDEKLDKLRMISGISSEQSNVLSVSSGEPGKIYYRDYRDLASPLASGTCATDGMIVCPCSGSTLGAIASGTNTNLIHRAADVQLKERRPLVLVLRESPLSLVYVENMRRAARAGAVLLPAAPGFYHNPKTIQDMVDFVVARVCDQLGIVNNLIERWGS
ncbi:MAG TPA: 3-octaprenyl-4-hydroxybenzoate carboxy-lyase [Planctomycetaceae bacterium]|nr:3-octaprenyl-4-hydroxybenzoate carboxy-lyase [Planctomycetaceae bacterium]